MGRELCAHAVFQQSLEDASTYLVSIGASWSLLRKLFSIETIKKLSLLRAVSCPGFPQLPHQLIALTTCPL